MPPQPRENPGVAGLIWFPFITKLGAHRRHTQEWRWFANGWGDVHGCWRPPHTLAMKASHPPRSGWGVAGSFNAKLEGLAKVGHLSPSQHNALNAVVDAGKAAAHRGFVPTRDAAQAMLDAVEVLLKSAYVLPGAAQSLQAMTPRRPPKSKV